MSRIQMLDDVECVVWTKVILQRKSEASMMKVFRLVGITMILVVGLCVVSQAADEPNFRAMGVPAEISICESADLLSRLQLTGEQQEQLQDVLGDGKARFLTAKSKYEARPAAQQRGPYERRRDNLLRNAISDLLDDGQHQLFHQMLALNFQSPVQASGAFRFDLKLTEKQHEQLHELETQWIQYALEQVPCRYRYPRHTEERDISKYGPLLKYGGDVARVAWDFVPRRDEQWNRILTPEQAKRWKQRELQSIFPFAGFDILQMDFRSAREDRKPLDTGTWMDNNVPYLTPPVEALQWSEEQLKSVQKQVRAVSFGSEPLPSDPAERAAVLAERQQQVLESMRQIEQIMTAEQRAIFWDLIGEPAAGNRLLQKMKANSEAAAGPAKLQPDADREQR